MSEYKEQLIELFENVSGCEIQEFGSDQLPFLADYIIGQQEADNACIEKLKYELKTERDHNQRLIDIATNHATRADELYELLSDIKEDLLERGDVDSDGCIVVNLGNGNWQNLKELLDKSRIEAEEWL